MKKNTLRVVIFAAILVVFWTLVAVIAGPKVFDVKAWTGFAAELQLRLAASPAVFAAIFLVVMVALAAFSFPVLSPFAVVAGILFGTLAGTLLTMLGAGLGGMVGYMVAARFLSPQLRESLPKQIAWMTQIQGRFGILGLLALRTLPLLPHAIYNAVAGVIAVKPLRFFWTTVVGSFPLCFVYAWVGRGAWKDMVENGAFPYQIVVLVAVVVALAVAGFFVKRALDRRASHEHK